MHFPMRIEALPYVPYHRPPLFPPCIPMLFFPPKRFLIVSSTSRKRFQSVSYAFPMLFLSVSYAFPSTAPARAP